MVRAGQPDVWAKARVVAAVAKPGSAARRVKCLIMMRPRWLRRDVSPPFAARHEGEALAQMHVLLILEKRDVQRRDQALWIALAQGLGGYVLDHQKLEPVEQLRGRG